MDEAFGLWPIRSAADCSTGSTSATGRAFKNCAKAWRWPGNR